MPPSKTKNMITIIDWRKIKERKLYKGMIKTAVANNKHLRVVIENLDNSQLGRLHDISLPLPVRPGSRTSRFLTSTGQDADTVGNRIVVGCIVGAVVGMRFYSSDGSDKDIEFERIEPAAEDKDNHSVADDSSEALL